MIKLEITINEEMIKRWGLIIIHQPTVYNGTNGRVVMPQASEHLFEFDMDPIKFHNQEAIKITGI